MLRKTHLISAALGAFLFSSVAEAQPAVEPALTPPRCEYGTPHANAPEQLSEFAFLIGDFVVVGHRWTGEAWSPPGPNQFRWNGYYGLDGMAIIDEWFDTDPGIDPDTSRGINVRTFDPNSGEWDMMWVHNRPNQVQDLRARMIGDRLTMWQIYPNRPNFRAYFEVIDENNWHRISLIRDAEGNWVNQFRLSATRIPCPE